MLSVTKLNMYKLLCVLFYATKLTKHESAKYCNRHRVTRRVCEKIAQSILWPKINTQLKPLKKVVLKFWLIVIFEKIPKVKNRPIGENSLKKTLIWFLLNIKNVLRIQGPILPNTIFTILHIFVIVSHKYV
jgi:ERCC4-type nuclease